MNHILNRVIIKISKHRRSQYEKRDTEPFRHGSNDNESR